MFESRDFYMGLTGAEMEQDLFDLGGGLSLQKTYAHLMKPLIMAFAPAVNGVSNPGPWKSLYEGSGYDIRMELHVSEAYLDADTFDRLNVGWWIIALIRLLCAPKLLAPVVSSTDLKSIPLVTEEPNVFPLETGRVRISIGESETVLKSENLEWVRKHWKSGAKLMRFNKAFNLAFQAFDQKAFSADPDLYLLALWAALEALFSPSRTELRFRASGLIATYLEPPGQSRYELHKDILKLYDARSAAVHGSMTLSIEELISTHQLARRILIKAIQDNRVPDLKSLEQELFGFVS